MNIESEIKHFSDLSPLDQARFLARFMYELTLEALSDVDEGRTIPHEEVLAMIERRKRERREARGHSAV